MTAFFFWNTERLITMKTTLVRSHWSKRGEYCNNQVYREERRKNRNVTLVHKPFPRLMKYYDQPKIHTKSISQLNSKETEQEFYRRDFDLV